MSLRREARLYSTVPMALSTPVAPLTACACQNQSINQSIGGKANIMYIYIKVINNGISRIEVQSMFRHLCIRVYSVVIHYNTVTQQGKVPKIGHVYSCLVSVSERETRQNESENMCCEK